MKRTPLQEKTRETSQFWSKAKIKSMIHRTRAASLGLTSMPTRRFRPGTRKSSRRRSVRLRRDNRIIGMTAARGLKLTAKIRRRQLEGAIRYYRTRGETYKAVQLIHELVLHCQAYFKRGSQSAAEQIVGIVRRVHA